MYTYMSKHELLLVKRDNGERIYFCCDRVTRRKNGARWRLKNEREEKGVGGAGKRGGEKERYVLLEDWKRETTGKSVG